MKLSIEEKKLLYAYGCPNHHNTVTRLKWVTSLTVDPEIKSRVLALVWKIDSEDVARWYPCFYRHLWMEMDRYFQARLHLLRVENHTNYEEDMYDEAV